jgi:hypothetical protein
MKFWIFCLVLGVLPGFGKDSRPELVPIALYTKFENPVSPEVEVAIQKEVGDIMRPIGINFDWRDLTGTTGSEISIELAVITFKGACSVEGGVTRSFSGGALGWTHVSDGVILPFADVDCNRIHSFLQSELAWRNPATRDQLFARAVGRVLAHELYHIFANTSHHGSCGVGKAAYSVNELLSNEFRFEESETRVLRTKQLPFEMPTSGAGTY